MSGTPDTRPVSGSNAAQLGRPTTEKVSVSPSGSEAAGVNSNGFPTVTEPGAVPEMVGGRLGRSLTVIANGARSTLPKPSDTEMTIPE